MEIKMPVFPGPRTSVVGKISVDIGDKVVKDQEIMQVETKKGNRTIRSLCSGTVKNILVHEGDTIENEQSLFIIEEDKKAETEAEINTSAATAEEKKADILIIGGGFGGYMAAIMANKKGRKAVLIEKSDLGGTCLNVGCIPTKSFIASSEAYRKITEAASFGISFAGHAEPDMPKIVERKDKIVQKLRDGVSYLMNKNHIEVIKGTASFTDNSHVKILADKEYHYSFNDCIIATGSKVSKPGIPGIDLPVVMDSTAALSLEKLPQSITIVGGGVIGLEFAFMYANLGVKVTIVEFLDHLISCVDCDIADSILKIAEDRGIKIELSSKVTNFSQSLTGEAIVAFEKDGKQNYCVSEKVLVAIGRQSRLEDLALENTSIRLNERGRGISVDSHMETNVKHIYAVGDCNNIIQLAHAAAEEGMIAVKNIIGEKCEFDKSKIPSVIFTSPEIATVGLLEDEAKKKGISYKVGKFSYVGNGKALTMGETEGYVKIIKNEKDIIIGGSVIGADASSLIAPIALCVTNGLTDEAIDKTVFAHPTTSEVIREASLDLSLGSFNE